MRRLAFFVVLLMLLAVGALAWANSHNYRVSPAVAAQATLLERGAERLLVEVAVPELQLGVAQANGATWDVLAVDGLGVAAVTGAPMLPVWTRLIEVGPTEGISVRLVDAEVENLAGYQVLPYQLPMDRSATELPPFVVNEELYTADALWPSEPVATDAPVIIHGRRFVPVRFYPVRHNPVSGEVVHVKRAVLEITGGQVDERNALARELPVSPAFAGIYNQMTWSFSGKDQYDNWAPVDGALLVIVYDNFANGIAPYVHWKRLKGLTVEVVLTSEIEGGGQDATAIKQMLYERYQDPTQPPLDYVLLVGDYPQITTLVGIGNSAADSRFVTLDGADYFPDTIIGRFSVPNLEALARVVNKMVDYEQNPPLANPNWYHMGLTMSGSDSVDDYNARYCGQVLEQAGGFDQVDYFFTSNGMNKPVNITASINEGRSWISYFGHGSATSWSSPSPSYTNQHVQALANQRTLPVITSIACTNAAFDWPGDCFAELWIKHSETAGAAGIFAASRSTPFGYTDSLGRGVAMGHFVEGYMTFGAASYYGKMYMYQDYPEPAGGTCEKVFQHYLVFGDPELNIWSDTPIEMSVEPMEEIYVGDADATLRVTVNDTLLPRALVHVWRGEDFDAAARTDDTGKALLEFGAPLTEGTLEVFVTGHNALPYSGQIEVVQALDDDTVADDDAADDDLADDDITDDDLADDDVTDDDVADDDDDDSGGCGG